MVIDHFRLRKGQGDIMEAITDQLDSLPSLYLLNHFLSNAEDPHQYVAVMKRKKTVSMLIDRVSIPSNESVMGNSFEKMQLSVLILNRIIQLDSSLFPLTTTLLVSGMQYLHSVIKQLKGYLFFELPKNECVLNWLVLMNAFLSGQTQRFALQCASYVIQYFQDITKVFTMHLLRSSFFIFSSLRSNFRSSLYSRGCCKLCLPFLRVSS